MLDLYGTPDEIIEEVQSKLPDVDIKQLIFDANIKCHKYKGSIQPYQAAVLYYVAQEYNFGDILEVGTGVGYSTYFLANACPNSKITTLNPNENEISIARNTLSSFDNIQIVNYTSRQWYDFAFDERGYAVLYYDFIFIDGNHKDIEFDVKWYDLLEPNGTIVYHDFSDIDSKSPCPPVYETLSKFANEVEPDVIVKDTINKYGLIGWIKR